MGGRATAGADPRFAVRRRGPYWRPGDSVIAEPWVALAETTTGHLVVRCGRSRAAALAQVQRWRLLAERVGPDLTGRLVVGGAVVDPHGGVSDAWGSVPVPGGPPRWSSLLRLLEARPCVRCAAPRWAGCWVGLGVSGCALCLPGLEVADPRVWPPDPAPPVERVARRRALPRRAAPRVAVAPPGDQGDLLSHRSAIG